MRRLEKVNGIGVFSGALSSPAEQRKDKSSGTKGSDLDGEVNEEEKPQANAGSDKIPLNEGFFNPRSIIVALTACSLQSDRHVALGGCNNFLTKPANFVWLERQVKEWDCMQALIEFDGWRRWNDYAAKEDPGMSGGAEEKGGRRRGEAEAVDGEVGDLAGAADGEEGGGGGSSFGMNGFLGHE